MKPPMSSCRKACDGAVLSGTQMSDATTRRVTETSFTTPATRYRCPSTSKKRPRAGAPPNIRSRAASPITATRSPFSSSSRVNGPPSRKVNSKIRQNASSVSLIRNSSFSPPLKLATSRGWDTIDISSTCGRSRAYQSMSL
jgi:hypothetical protein